MGLFSRFWLNPASKMLMPKKNRIAIYEHLFKEGVMVAKKDFNLPKHPELEIVPNLHVITALTSLKSRGYVKEQFAWRHYYWYLTNEGIQYLRDFLHLPPEIVPATLKRQARQRLPSQGPNLWIKEDLVDQSTNRGIPTGGDLLVAVQTRRETLVLEQTNSLNSKEDSEEASQHSNRGRC